MNLPLEGPPNPRSWASKDAAAARRWDAARQAVNDLAADLGIPAENLLSPDALRRLLWQPDGLDEDSIDAQLAGYNVRSWQRGLVVPVISASLATDSTD